MKKLHMAIMTSSTNALSKFKSIGKNREFLLVKGILVITALISLFASCEPPTTKEQVVSDKNQLESGDANSPVSFNDGLVAEYTVIQSKALKITDYLDNNGKIGDSKCTDFANELIKECNRVIKVLNKIDPVGVDGIQLRNHAIEYSEAVKAFAIALSSSDESEIFGTLGRIAELEEGFIELQKVYAKKNGFIIGGDVVDPRELE